MSVAEPKPKLHTLLSPIIPEEYSRERFQKLWEKLFSQEYALDDLVRNDPSTFLAQFAFPSNLFWEIGDLQGFVSALGVQPGLDAQLHFAVWDPTLKITDLMKAGQSLQTHLFETYNLNRISAHIPDQNLNARRLATLLWFVEEGNIRKSFLNKGNYSDIRIFGLLRSEFNRYRREGM